MTTASSLSRARLLAGAALFAAVAMPAQAQDVGPAATAPAPAPAAQDTQGDADTIVVTGSILRGGDTGVSPVTTLTSANLDARGINTVQDAIQQLSSNNGAALTNSFTANGAFAAGASAVSLRGLSTSSTLVLFDGLRAAYYPLADDGSRNFVDLNTIPDDIVDRIEVLRDGASASYGADAIAGVVNVITKRKFEGVSGRAEAGIAERGFGANQRVTLTAGTGDLDEKGYNAYVSGFYFRSSAVRNDDLPAPFNSDDRRGIGGPNNIINGQNAAGALGPFSLGSTLYVRPGTTGRYQILNAGAGCAAGPAVTPNAAELAANATLPVSNVCQEDFTNQYGVVSPKIERFGGSARFTAKVGDNAEAYLAVNFQQTSSSYTGDPAVIRGNAPAGILYPQFSTSSGAANFAAGSGILTLPVYVCAGRVNCTAANGTLNPNNPFAANGQTAQLVGRSPTGVTRNETRSRVYRGAMGITGTAFGDWDYKVDATAMHTDLARRQNGYVYIQHLLDVIADGTYNFVNPSLNSAAVNDYLTPENVSNASSDLYQAQATVSKTLFDLPGGPLQLGVGGSIFYEAIDAPSANPDTNGPTQRYFSLNAFGTEGNRTVSSAFFEINAPVIDQIELSASGRYDSYSTGQSNFSPKAGILLKPIRQVTLRGTYSRGFRIPSFAEANALPTTGYVTQQISGIPNAFLAQYGANCSQQNQAGCPTYLTTYSIGNTTLASPDLKPEKSRSFTGGIVFQPISQISLTVDYFNIKKTGAITSASTAPAIAAYYAGTTIPDGFNVIADAADVNNPNARPRIGFVQSQLINSDTLNSEGIDFGATGRFDLGPVRWTTNLAASWLLNLSTTFPDGTKEKYVGTLGNFNLTAGSGTFEWKGNWTNTFEFDKVAISGTLNYTDGYDLSAMDQGDAYKDCGQSPGYTGCHVKSYVTFDLNAAVNVTDKVQVYFNALNLFDRLPAIDPVTYGAYLYNAVQAGNGIYGRSFRAGAKFGF
ncbi:TonB-dependent receptor domain-containing protein [Sphingomonas prati]|uniref:Iron complex outermembrane receptor protein n=1 Tax=Sphingomonas prati TaxID=1843237 RepID=A0A7W9BQ38_9SPHN|nr:TonB-dependent receptor [Sphingomonas prati]MBB5728022.1 iron complex outermembrane receptor protein [Sphingomonas prati]